MAGTIWELDFLNEHPSFQSKTVEWIGRNRGAHTDELGSLGSILELKL